MRLLFFSLLFISTVEAADMRALLFHGNCVTCHFETTTESAPSVVDFKENYLRAFPLKNDFIEYMSKWILKPNKETSIMADAINKHGLMPELGYDLSTLKEISAYIYDTDFAKEHEGHK